MSIQFDWQFYINSYDDLQRERGVHSLAAAEHHFVTAGQVENEPSTGSTTPSGTCTYTLMQT